MSFNANVKKFQSIEDGTISVLLKVPAESASAIMELYKQDVMVVPQQIEILEDRAMLLQDLRAHLINIGIIISKLEQA